MLVRDIMTRSVRSATPETRLLEVVSLMTLYRLSGIPVVEGGKLVGIIAERDVLRRLFPKLEDLMSSLSNVDYDSMMSDYRNVVRLKVGDVMTPRPLTVAPDMHVLKAASIMAGRRFRRIPVADGATLVGMVSLGDVHKAIFHANISQTMGLG
jgi:CBS domain-containing protein